MEDRDILQRLLQKAYNDDAVSPAAKKEYERLVLRFPEDGAEQEISVNDLDEVQEIALRNLREEDYTTQSLRYHGPGVGHVLHVNLRGKKFLNFANGQTVPVVVGMQDSGERQSFETGAVRDTAEGKSRPDLISPFATERLGDWLMLGAQKYSERNWERGIPVSRTLASLHRHLMKYQQGSKDEDHLAAIMCNAMFILHTEEMVKRGVLPESLLDMPDYHAMPRTHRNGDEPYDT